MQQLLRVGVSFTDTQENLQEVTAQEAVVI